MTEIKISLPNIADGEDKSLPFKNRIRKNYRHIRKWAKRTQTNCFRIYDLHIPQYRLAIDFYNERFSVQYFAPSRELEDPPSDLVEETEQTLVSLFNVAPDSIYWKTRFKREKTEQYEKLDKSKDTFTVLEYGIQFKINLVDYLDTGLFLDHRETRKMVASLAKGKRLLNLFAYTCSFSVHAAAMGASFTKSVDMSNTYTSWGEENFLLNELSLKNNEIVRADCLKFLENEVRSGIRYDIIVIDPPTISRSKKMDQMFDIQKDYIFLIEKSLKLLNQGGVIFFSTNSRKFSFDTDHFNHCFIVDITEKTIPLDFYKPKIHRCWKISAL